MHEEKRAHRRIALQSEGWIADPLGNSWTQITLLDLSAGGIAFVGKEQLTQGSSRGFRFQLPGQSKPIGFIGQVMHCIPHPYLGGFRVGVQFSRIDPHDRASIDTFVLLTCSQMATGSSTA